jgi:HK97 family phage major capsid protein
MANSHADDLRQKLTQVEDDLSQLRTDRAEKVRVRDEAKSAFAAVDGYDTNGPEYLAAVDKSREVSEIDERIVDTQNAQVGILKMLGQSDPEAPRERERSKAIEQDGEGHWSGQRVIDGDAYKALAQHPAIHTEKAHVGTHVLGEVVSAHAFKAAVQSSDLGLLIQPEYRGLNTLPLRPMRLLDLLPVGNTTSSSIDYVQEVNTADTVAETAEGVLKPEESIDFVDATAVVRTIAGWIKINKQTLADAPMIQGYIDGRLRLKVRRRLETQVAAGNGTGSNIRGILNITGVQTPTVVTAESGIDRLHHGIVAVQLADHEPSFIGVSPQDWETIRLKREESAAAGTATGGYLMGAPSIAGGLTLFGLPVVVSQAFPVGTGLVGDAAAALVLLREGVNVLISDSDQDDFIRNRVTMLGETRAGVMLWAPDAFAKVNLGVVA